MKQLIITFGLIVGGLLAASLVLHTYIFYNHPAFKGGETLGYATMVVIFSLVYFGVRKYRDQHLGGKITFGKAFKQGAIIALIGSSIYVIAWLLAFYFIVPDFMDQYIERFLADIPVDEYEAQKAKLEGYKDMYQNPLFAMLITFTEVLPVGLIDTLISALILKNSTKQSDLQPI